MSTAARGRCFAGRRASRCTAGRATTSAASRAPARLIGGGLAVTGNYPGKARTADELRADLDQALSPDPRHATASTCTPATPRPAAGGSSATSCGPSTSAAGSTGPRRSGLGLDFNPTFFAHPKAADGFTLAHPRRGHPPVLDRARHRLPADRRGDRPGARARRASPTSGSPTATRTRRSTARRRASACAESLDAIFAEPLDPRHQPRRGRGQAVRHRLGELRRRLARVLPRLRDRATEAALPRRRPLPPDRGHRRQDLGRADVAATRSCCTSAAACAGTATTWSRSRDELRAIAQEVVRGDYLDRVHIGLDFFDASINRVAAWVIGTRAHAQGAADRAARADRRCCGEREAAGDFTAPAGAAGGAEDAARSARSGITTA